MKTVILCSLTALFCCFGTISLMGNDLNGKQRETKEKK